ncbi:MAG: hypothetical protein ACI9YT_001427 [Halobacteriales archaeon]|jgi:hypothetical protein
MATADGTWYGGYTVDSAADGIHVRKSLDLDTLALLAVRVRIESRRDERVGVVLEDEVPEPVSVHDVGFHEEHGAEYWHVYDGGRLRWVNTLATGASTSTLYGVWFSDPRDVYDVFEPVTVDLVRPLLRGDRFAPRLDGREVPKHSMDAALEAGRFESADALRTEIAVALGHPRRSPGDANNEQRRPRPAAHGPAIERAGEVDLDPPAPTAIHALDDQSTAGERLFVKVPVREATVPQVDESVSTAGDVLGRRIRDHRSGHELLETVLATAHAPDVLAAMLAERNEVGGVLVAIVDETMPRAPDGARSMTEFALLQREVEAALPDRIDPPTGRRPNPSGSRSNGFAVESHLWRPRSTDCERKPTTRVTATNPIATGAKRRSDSRPSPGDGRSFATRPDSGRAGCRRGGTRRRRPARPAGTGRETTGRRRSPTSPRRVR